MTRRHVLLWIVLMLVAGCGVRPSGVITGGPAPTAPAEGVSLYFITNSTSLVRVRRPTPQHLSPTQTLLLLQAGPSGDDGFSNLTTEVPTGLGPVSVTIDASGKADIGVTADVTTLSSTAVDQIVCTVGEALSSTAPITVTSGAATRGPRICPLTG